MLLNFIHLLTVHDFLRLLTPISNDYVTRPFSHPPQRKMGKSRLATQDKITSDSLSESLNHFEIPKSGIITFTQTSYTMNHVIWTSLFGKQESQ